jgi:hypothetical protein
MRRALRVACRSASQSVQRDPLVVGSPQVRQGLGIGMMLSGYALYRWLAMRLSLSISPRLLSRAVSSRVICPRACSSSVLRISLATVSSSTRSR